MNVKQKEADARSEYDAHVGGLKNERHKANLKGGYVMIWRQTVIGIIVWLLATISVSGPSFAGQSPLRIVRPEGNWPPKEMVVDGYLTGIHIELIREAADRLNLSVTFIAFPWPRAIDMVKTGRADAITFMSPTEERKRFGYFLTGNILSTAPVGLVTLKETALRIGFSGDLRALELYKIGTIRGYSYGDAFDHATWLQKDSGATNDRQLLRKLQAGRFEIVAAYIHDISYQAQTMGILGDIKMLRPYLSQGQANYLVFSKANHHASLAQRFADTLIAFKSTPRYRELLKKFGIH